VWQEARTLDRFIGPAQDASGPSPATGELGQDTVSLSATSSTRLAPAESEPDLPPQRNVAEELERRATELV